MTTKRDREKTVFDLNASTQNFKGPRVLISLDLFWQKINYLTVFSKGLIRFYSIVDTPHIISQVPLRGPIEGGLQDQIEVKSPNDDKGDENGFKMGLFRSVQEDLLGFPVKLASQIEHHRFFVLTSSRKIFTVELSPLDANQGY